MGNFLRSNICYPSTKNSWPNAKRFRINIGEACRFDNNGDFDTVNHTEKKNHEQS